MAAARLGRAPTAEKNTALHAAAELLLQRADNVLAANQADLDDAAAAGMEPGPLDRMRLDADRLAGMAAGLRDVAALPDPIGEVLDGWRRPNRLLIERIRVPLGVVAIIYENRPNVTSDAAGIFLKSGGAIQEVACWTHCRRYWWEARTSDSRRAHQALAYIERLYPIDEPPHALGR